MMSNLLLVPYLYLPGHLEKKLKKKAYSAVFENIGKYVLFVFLQNMNNTEKTFLLAFIVISEG